MIASLLILDLDQHPIMLPKRLFFLFLLGTQTVVAQMIPMTYQMSTPGGNVPITTYMYMPRYYGQQRINSFPYDYKIVLNNDSTIVSFTKIHISESVHFLKVRMKKGEKKIELHPKDTKVIYCLGNSQQLKGIPADTCWLFLTEKGKINSYSFLPELQSDLVIAIQKGNDGPIVGLTEANLTSMVIDHGEAMKYVQKKKWLKAIKVYNK